MRTLGTIAVNVFRESIRDKVLYNLVVFAVLLIGASYLISQLTAGQDLKIIKDLGLAATSLFGLFIAIFIGIGLVSKEVERRSIYNILSKPVGREQFVLGKYLGLVFTLWVNVTLMTLSLYLVLAYMAWGESPALSAAREAPAIDPALLEAVVCIFLELMLVTAIAVFFSTFSSPFLSAALTFAVWIAGQFSADLKHLDTAVESPVAASIARGLYYVLPNFSTFDIKAAVVHGQPVAGSYLLLAAAYAAVYIAALLVGATAIFARRDFK